MKYKLPIYAILVFLVFVGLVFYNYLLAQKAIRETKSAPLSINLISYPQTIQVGQAANFVWRVNASADLYTPLTTICWGYESSPGALTRSDAPNVVHYQYSQPDYASGSFRLPENFDLNIPFNHPGRVWFRAYAKVKEDNLWTEEKYLDVLK